MDPGESTTADRVIATMNQVTNAMGTMSSAQQQVVALARSDAIDLGVLLELVITNGQLVGRLAELHAELLRAALDLPVSVDPAPPPHPHLVQRVSISGEELDDLLSGTLDWSTDPHDPGFEPPLTPGQRYLLALVQVAVEEYKATTLYELVVQGQSNSAVGARRAVTWLLRAFSGLTTEQIAKLFGKGRGTIEGYWSRESYNIGAIRYASKRIGKLHNQALGRARINLCPARAAQHRRVQGASRPAGFLMAWPWLKFT